MSSRIEKMGAKVDPIIAEFRSSNRSLRQHISHLLTLGSKKQREVWVDFFRSMFLEDEDNNNRETARMTYPDLCLAGLMPAFGIKEELQLLEVWVAVDRLDRGYVTFQQFKELLTNFRPPDTVPGPAEYNPSLDLVQPQAARQPFSTSADKELEPDEGNRKLLCYDPVVEAPSFLQVGRGRQLHDGTRPHAAEFGFGRRSKKSAMATQARSHRQTQQTARKSKHERASNSTR
jgi:hypothetical protein